MLANREREALRVHRGEWDASKRVTVEGGEEAGVSDKHSTGESDKLDNDYLFLEESPDVKVCGISGTEGCQSRRDDF